VLVRAVRGGRIEIETFRNLMRGTPISTVAAWAGTSSREIEDTYKRYIPTEDAYASAIDDLTPAAFHSFGH
jgi:hypothetical protein